MGTKQSYDNTFTLTDLFLIGPGQQNDVEEVQDPKFPH